MNKKNLHFFDKNGYNLNFEWNGRNGYWEGSVFLPKVSVGIHSNTSIYVLEESDGEFAFPKPSASGDTVMFYWDRLNKFVDEFFMFNFDENYILKDTSALVYTPNDGPDCNTLIINRFDEYEVELRDEVAALPIHIAFVANERENATTYNRTLVMSYGGETVARIRFYCETIEEDERLKVWNQNLGYNIKPEDTIIFYKSDIKEIRPDFSLLNEKRKELMLEGHNIYPYIGSYRAIINAIKFFGYDNLGIIEYWKNINQYDENFGKIYHSSRYSLTKKETLTIGARTITLPNRDYKKTNKIALVYSINQPTGEVDEWELPLVKEKFTYTIEEALIKLYALRNKLNKEFMPGSSRIIDIIGEANYFGIHALHKTNMVFDALVSNNQFKTDFEVKPGKYVHITDDRYFDKYIVEKKEYEGEQGSYEEKDKIKQFNVINDISSMKISDVSGETVSLLTNEKPDDIEICDLYTDYYNEVFIEHSRFEEPEDKDEYFAPASAKVVLENTSFVGNTFGESDICFGYRLHQLKENPEGRFDQITYVEDDCSDDTKHITFGNIDSFWHESVSWRIEMSQNQVDDELENIGKNKTYPIHEDFIIEKSGGIEDCKKIFVKLPYVGYYDVTITIDGKKHKKTKCIKVEPYHIDIKGFYYDTRELPEDMRYEIEEGSDMYNFIQDRMRDMIGWAVSEKTSDEYVDDDFAMTTYTTNGTILNKSPYYTRKIIEEWQMADNVSYQSSLLIPDIKYVRYVRNGVDVKPFTWFILGYEYTKIVGKIEPEWTIINNNTHKERTYSGKYMTCLLREEGNYTIKLTVKDNNGNTYEASRNIFVVKKDANHKIYQTFKKEYDYLEEQRELELTRSYQTFFIDDDYLEEIQQ